MAGTISCWSSIQLQQHGHWSRQRQVPASLDGFLTESLIELSATPRNPGCLLEFEIAPGNTGNLLGLDLQKYLTAYREIIVSLLYDQFRTVTYTTCYDFS